MSSVISISSSVLEREHGPAGAHVYIARELKPIESSKMRWFFAPKTLPALVDSTTNPPLTIKLPTIIANTSSRYDLVEECVDKVEAGFDIYLKHENGNPLVYDEARKSGVCVCFRFTRDLPVKRSRQTKSWMGSTRRKRAYALMLFVLILRSCLSPAFFLMCIFSFCHSRVLLHKGFTCPRARQRKRADSYGQNLVCFVLFCFVIILELRRSGAA